MRRRLGSVFGDLAATAEMWSDWHSSVVVDSRKRFAGFYDLHLNDGVTIAIGRWECWSRKLVAVRKVCWKSKQMAVVECKWYCTI